MSTTRGGWEQSRAPPRRRVAAAPEAVRGCPRRAATPPPHPLQQGETNHCGGPLLTRDLGALRHRGTCHPGTHRCERARGEARQFAGPRAPGRGAAKPHFSVATGPRRSARTRTTGKTTSPDRQTTDDSGCLHGRGGRASTDDRARFIDGDRLTKVSSSAAARADVRATVIASIDALERALSRSRGRPLVDRLAVFREVARRTSLRQWPRRMRRARRVARYPSASPSSGAVSTTFATRARTPTPQMRSSRAHRQPVRPTWSNKPARSLSCPRPSATRRSTSAAKISTITFGRQAPQGLRQVADGGTTRARPKDHRTRRPSTARDQSRASLTLAPHNNAQREGRTEFYWRALQRYRAACSTARGCVTSTRSARSPRSLTRYGGHVLRCRHLIPNGGL